jgi:signal transduction histidine kinase
MRTAFSIITAFFLTVICNLRLACQADNGTIHNVLYINSYAVTYSWSDSIAKGIINTLGDRKDIILFVEYLDSKRFGNSNFNSLYQLYKEKYHNINFDVAIANDNNALEFLLEYGDSLIPDVPVAFCGVNNPEDYKLDNTRFYGIKEGVDKDSLNKLILRIMPDIEKLYFIADCTATSMVNIKYLKELEPGYIDKVKFEYIINISIDSLMKVVKQFEKGNAIALIDIFKDSDGAPVKPDVITERISKISPVPIFIDHQAVFGKGICGGIINDGVAHGKDVAALALKFIDNPPGFKPENRIEQPEDNYYFDYKILKKYLVNTKLIPAGARIINKPNPKIIRYLKYIIILGIVVIIMVVFISIHVVSVTNRRRIEKDLQQKILEIQDQNIKLEESNRLVNEMNAELENINEYLSAANTELNEAKMKSEESDRLKTAFLANMSHEIRTPLNAIVGFANLLGEPDIPDEDYRYYVDIINSNSEQLLKLIDDILDLSKAEAEVIPVKNEYFSFQEVAYELINSIPNYRNKDIDIRISTFSKKNPLMLHTDIHRFKQILSNLLSNAVKFTEKGYVELGHTFEKPGEVTIYIKDTGVGIDKKDLMNIFNRFWKIEKKGEYFNPGTGLGLAISKKLCEILKGRIWAESEPGKGSVFYFTLPYTVTDNIKPANEDSKKNITREYNWKGYTVAVVEDEQDNLLFLYEILKKNKADVISFQNGIEVVDFFNSRKLPKVDLILMDIKMPKMDGNEALKRIKKLHPEIPVIAQTAYAMKSDTEGMKNSKYDDIIVKPIKSKELSEKIDKILVSPA